MIIEGAFSKLPEILLGHMFPSAQLEATLTNYLAMGVLLELSARNIQLPMEHVHIERPYREIPGSGPSRRADLYVRLDNIFGTDFRYKLYGMKTNNWIETKFFSGLDRQVVRPPGTENAAQVALALLRLCLFVQEERSSDRDNARYLLLVFNREPTAYLAFSRASLPNEREWLNLMLQPGDRSTRIRLKDEPPSFKEVFGPRLGEQGQNLDFELRVITQTFSPIEPLSEYLYWGYLIRVVDFTISLGGDVLIYKDASQAVWSADQEEIQKRLIERFLQAQ